MRDATGNAMALVRTASMRQLMRAVVNRSHVVSSNNGIQSRSAGGARDIGEAARAARDIGSSRRVVAPRAMMHTKVAAAASSTGEGGFEYYTLLYEYVPDILDKRGPYRGEHIANAKKVVSQFPPAGWGTPRKHSRARARARSSYPRAHAPPHPLHQPRI